MSSLSFSSSSSSRARSTARTPGSPQPRDSEAIPSKDQRQSERDHGKDVEEQDKGDATVSVESSVRGAFERMVIEDEAEAGDKSTDCNDHDSGTKERRSGGGCGDGDGKEQKATSGGGPAGVSATLEPGLARSSSDGGEHPRDASNNATTTSDTDSNKTTANRDAPGPIRSAMSGDSVFDNDNEAMATWTGEAVYRPKPKA